MKLCKKTFIHLLMVVFCLLMTDISFARNDNPVVVDQSETDRFNIDILKDMIPPGSYRITDWYEGLSDVFVINIQDYHCNYPTQKQAVVLLNKLFQKNSKLKINFIGLEGTSGWVNTGFATAVPDEDIKSIVADNFLKDGVISGAEYFSIVSSEPALLYGVDAPESYIKNAELYFRLQDDLVPQREEAKKLLAMIRGICMDAGRDILDRRELDFFEKFVQFHNHDISSVDFAQYLHVLVQSYDIDSSRYEQFMTLIETLSLQSKIDLKSLEYEKFDLLNRMKKILSQEDYTRLVKANMRFSIGTLSAQTLYRLFYRYAGEYKIGFKKDSEFKKMNSVFQKLSLLKEPVLKEELQQLVDLILDLSKMLDGKRDLFRLSYALIVMNSMIDLTASRSEYDYYQKNPHDFSVTKIIDTIKSNSEDTDVFMLSNLDWSRFNQILGFAGNFYAQAVKRDEQMVNNALVMNDRMDGKNLVIMSGGFHTEGLARIFKERDISYAVLSPEVVSKDYRSSYESIMLNISPPFDAVLAGLASKLMPSSTFNSLLHPENEQILMAKWIIFSNALMTMDFSELGDREKMQEEFDRNQVLWFSTLEMNLKTTYKKLIQKGILTEDFIKIALNEFNRQLNSIEFDFENARLHETSASIPVILYGREMERIIISVDQDLDLVADDILFRRVLEQKVFAQTTLRVISPKSMQDKKLFSELLNKEIDGASDKTRQNMFVLADLFGLETVETLLSNINKDNNPMFFEKLSHADIKKLLQIIGLKTARELLLWDMEGFLNLVYATSKMEDFEDFYSEGSFVEDYVNLLLSQKFLKFNKYGHMPSFVIEEASQSDINLWYSYGIFRKFQPIHWEESVDTNELFYKAVSPDGRVLGMVTARPVPQMKVMYIDFLETCSFTRRQGIGEALLKKIVMDSFVTEFNGAVALFPEEGSQKFYTDRGFVSVDGKYWILSPEKASELFSLQTKKVEAIHIREKLDTVARHKTVSDEEAMTRLGRLMQQDSDLTDDDQLFIVAMISKYDIVSLEEAREIFIRTFINTGDIESEILSLYDRVVDAYIKKTQVDVDDYDAVRPVIKTVPDVIIEKASESDIDLWYADGVKRVFTKDRWLRDKDYFYKAVSPEGKILGMISAVNDEDDDGVYINFIETSSIDQNQGIGEYLLTQIVKDSLASQFKGRVILIPGKSRSFYEKRGFAFDGNFYWILSPDKALEYVSEREKPDLEVLNVVDNILLDIEQNESSTLVLGKLSRTEINKLIQIIGIDSTRELFSWDPNGFLNLMDVISKTDGSKDSNFVVSYVNTLLSQKSFGINKDGGIPGFVIEKASNKDIDEWFSYGIDRIFTKKFQWSNRTHYFYKAVSPEGKILGMVTAEPDIEKNAIRGVLIETCLTARGLAVGDALQLQIVRESLASEYNGAVVVDPRDVRIDSIEKSGFVKEGDGEFWRLSPAKARELVASREKSNINERNIVRPVSGNVFSVIPKLNLFSSKAVREYVGLLKEISELRENYVDSSFSKTLAERPSSINFVKSILNRVGLLIDIQLLPSDDVRIKGKTATLLNNIVYFNSSATVVDMWFFLPHEVSHLLGDERHARMHDTDSIRNLKSIALTLVEIAEQTTSAQQAELLRNMASGISQNALYYELDIFTAKLQLTPRGRAFLEKYNLPRFKNVSQSYIKSVASFSKDRLSPSIDDDFKTEIEWLLKNAGSDINQTSQRLSRKIFRNLIDFSIQEVTTSTDKINTKMSSWIVNQVGRDLWSTEGAKLPDSFRKFITRSQSDAGVIDIRVVQKRVCTALRNMKDLKAKVRLEKDIIDGLIMLIRENVEPDPYISELPDVLQRQKANCAGFSRLFHVMAVQFGLADKIVSVELDYEGEVQLHVVNLIKLSDGENYMKSITELSGFSTISKILLRVKNEDEWEYQLITEDELSRMDPDQITGFDQNALDAISYNVSASVAMGNGDVQLAFSRISKAYKLMPDNPYVTVNMAQIDYLHWLNAMKMMGLSVSSKDKWDKIGEVIRTYNLHLIEPRITAFLFEDILMVENAVDPVGGGGQVKFPVNKVTKPADVSKPTKKPDTGKVPIKPEEKSIVSTPLPSLSDQLTKVALLSKQSTGNRPLSQTQKIAGLDAYRTQNLVSGGLSFQSAKQLINVSSTIEADIRNQQFRQAEAKLMGLHPDFAHRVMVQNPWIMVFMIELMPEWWKGSALLELSKKVRINEAIREMIRKQLETVTPVTEISDKDPFRKEPEVNLFWSMMHQQRVLTSLEQKFQKGDISEDQYREIYDLLIVGDVAPMNKLSPNQKQLLFGKRDEILIKGGIRIENGFILGGIFAEFSVRPEGESYSSFIKNLMEEHPQELSSVMNKIGVPITEKLNEARGGLAMVAEDLFEKSDKDEIAEVIADNILSTEILEAVFTSNMERDGVTDSINRVLKELTLEIGELVVLVFFKKYYVEGDELTDQFKKSLRLVQRLMKESSQFKEDITNIAVRLQNVDSGKFLYAFMRLAPQSEPSGEFRLPIAKMDHLVTGNHLVEQSL